MAWRMESLLFSRDLKGPVRLEVAAEGHGPQLQHRFGHGGGPAIPDRSIRSLIRFLQAPSTTPVARGHPCRRDASERMRPRFRYRELAPASTPVRRWPR